MSDRVLNGARGPSVARYASTSRLNMSHQRLFVRASKSGIVNGSTTTAPPAFMSAIAPSTRALIRGIAPRRVDVGPEHADPGPLQPVRVEEGRIVFGTFPRPRSVTGSAGSGPAIASRTRAASSTVRAIGPPTSLRR